MVIVAQLLGDKVVVGNDKQLVSDAMHGLAKYLAQAAVTMSPSSVFHPAWRHHVQIATLPKHKPRQLADLVGCLLPLALLPIQAEGNPVVNEPH